MIRYQRSIHHISTILLPLSYCDLLFLFPPGVYRQRGGGTMADRERSSERCILFVCDDWGSYCGGIASVNRYLALSLARFMNVKIYSTLIQPVSQVPIADLEDAQNHNVTLVGPQCTGSNAGVTPNLTLLNENPEQFFSHIKGLVPEVTHIVGHGPITAAAAIKLRDLYYANSKLILFYHVIPRDVEWLSGELTYTVPTDEDMIAWAEVADVVYSVSDKIHWFYSTRFRNRARVRIDHRLYLPQCAEQFFSVSRKEASVKQHSVVTFGSRRGAEKWEGSDIAACCSAKVGKALEGNDVKVSMCKTKPSLVIGGVPNDVANKAKDAVESFLKDQEIAHKLSDYCDQKQMISDLQNCSLCVLPNRAEPYGYHGLEALSAGIPTLLPDDSILASLVRRLTADPEHYIIPVTNDVTAVRQDSSVWRDRVLSLLQNPATAHDRALQLREALRKDDRIKETNDDFVTFCLGMLFEMPFW